MWGGNVAVGHGAGWRVAACVPPLGSLLPCTARPPARPPTLLLLQVAAVATLPLCPLLRQSRVSGGWTLFEVTSGVAEGDRIELGKVTGQLAWFPLQQQEEGRQPEEDALLQQQQQEWAVEGLEGLPGEALR